MPEKAVEELKQRIFDYHTGEPLKEFNVRVLRELGKPFTEGDLERFAAFYRETFKTAVGYRSIMGLTVSSPAIQITSDNDRASLIATFNDWRFEKWHSDAGEYPGKGPQPTYVNAFHDVAKAIAAKKGLEVKVGAHSNSLIFEFYKRNQAQKT